MKIDITKDELVLIIFLLGNFRNSIDVIDSHDGVEHDVFFAKIDWLNDLIFKLYQFNSDN